MNSNRKPTGQTTYETRERAGGTTQGRPSQNQPRKKRLRFKPNKEGMLALAILVLIVAVIITLVILTIRAIVNAVSSGGEETSSSTTESTAELPSVKAWNDGYTQTSVSSSDIASGSLILVNFEQYYSLTDSITRELTSLYGSTGHNSLFVLRDAEVRIRRDIAAPMRNMLTALVEANADTLGTDSSHDRVIISSGYRNTEKQTELYNDSIGTEDENLVAKPGYSEHHTGYAIDLNVFTVDGKTVEMRENEQAWLEENCAKYGFVLRYEGSKFEITGILDEPWHFRYVGIPHATYMMENGLCLEEYLELLKTDYTYPQSPLEISTEDAEYLVYYVPASTDSTTFVPVPPESVGTYEISGNNVDGFIVTVTKN